MARSGSNPLYYYVAALAALNLWSVGEVAAGVAEILAVSGLVLPSRPPPQVPGGGCGWGPCPGWGETTTPPPSPSTTTTTTTGWSTPVETTTTGWSTPVETTTTGWSTPVETTTTGWSTPVETTTTGWSTPVETTTTGWSTPVETTTTGWSTPVETTTTGWSTPVETTTTGWSTPVETTTTGWSTPVETTTAAPEETTTPGWPGKLTATGWSAEATTTPPPITTVTTTTSAPETTTPGWNSVPTTPPSSGGWSTAPIAGTIEMEGEALVSGGGAAGASHSSNTIVTGDSSNLGTLAINTGSHATLVQGAIVEQYSSEDPTTGESSSVQVVQGFNQADSGEYYEGYMTGNQISVQNEGSSFVVGEGTVALAASTDNNSTSGKEGEGWTRRNTNSP